ncbi:hypothetical protein HYDPIDRAFT_30209 [Hydnomerulius pinastri MD-312]|uniref:PH domain-containing protein n=1 Tax=Hydnomerulius pinastri MD-312 TaxID=994086 RepID=A0A0C9VAA4_9AGAM|nr:hypothetical protein HYDPIDRAFT_30209 [Hydnomerulius pinastri MD-312]
MSKEAPEAISDFSRAVANSAARGNKATPNVTQISVVFDEPFAVDDPRRLCQIYGPLTLSPDSIPLSMEQFLPGPAMLEVKQPISSSSSKKTGLLHSVKLPKKPSLQALFTPSFLQPSTPSTDPHPPSSFPPRARSLSAVAYSVTEKESADDYPVLHIPAPSLLDDDPFANLTSSIACPVLSQSPTSIEYPPLSEVPRPSTVVVSPRAHVRQAVVARPKSSGHGQVRPAHTKPAFTPRPSLPSLHTLAQMNVPVPRKVRKGTPGARLPHEPWNMDLSAEFSLPTRNRSSSAGPSQAPNTPSNIQPQEQIAQSEDSTLHLSGTTDALASHYDAELTSSDYLNSREQSAAADEISSSRSLSVDDADMDSLPSLSYTTSEPSSSALSRSSSIASSPWSEASMNQNSHANNHSQGPDISNPHHTGDYPDYPTDDDGGDHDPLSYHSDFDYYTQSLSDLSDFEPDEDPTTTQKTRQRSQSPDVGPTPYSSVYAPDVDFEPGSSADTMRRGLHERIQSVSRLISSPSKEEAPQDGGEWRGRRDVPERHGGREDERRGREGDDGRRGAGRGSHYSGGYGGGAGGDDNGDKDRRRKPRPSVSSTSDYSSSSDDADSNTVYYSVDGMSNGPSSRAQSRTRSRHSKAGGGSDDDVPLAQRMPTALTAQKSIRKQLRDERQQRRLERAKSSRTAAPPPPPVPAVPPVPAPAPRAGHAPRQRSMSAAPAPVSGTLRRERSRARPAPIEAFPVEDLTRKLINLHTSVHTPPPTAPPSYDASNSATLSARAAGFPAGVSRSSSRGRYMDQAAYMQQVASRAPESSSQDRPLRSARSFHRPEGRYAESQKSAVEGPSAQRIGRSITTASRRQPEEVPVRDVPSRSGRNGGDGTSATLDHLVKSGRVSEDSWRPSVSTSRPSVDRESEVAAQRVVQRPPVPPLPSPEVMSTLPQQHLNRVPVTQQRIFIGDMQRFNMVEITPATNAGDVIDIVAGQGMLDRSGSWMLFELAQDYGMERPIRDYELLADVSASWNKDKMLNAFVIKPTPLARILARSAMPTSSPTHRGWVEWESKRGKWSKRWMELREHSLWLSKRDTGKDEVFLCSLSNFDAYFVTRRHKSPKAFVFAVKSTDNLSLFENAADYLHVFSCNPKDGDKWMDAILVARSYVLYQERHVLFAKSGEALSQAKPLARSRTRKQSVSGRPAQPLISVPPPFSQAPAAAIAFEPGSLLAKRKDTPS